MLFKKTKWTIILLTTLIFITAIVSYNIYDNNRIALVKEEIKIDNLPNSFNNFK